MMERLLSRRLLLGVHLFFMSFYYSAALDLIAVHPSVTGDQADRGKQAGGTLLHNPIEGPRRYLLPRASTEAFQGTS